MTAEHITLGFFLAGLTFCVLTGTEVLFALLFGLVCFSLYSIRRGNSPGRTCSMLLEGASRVSNILIIFVLIGCLTASWRICGAIPFILYHAVSLIQPRYFVLCTFLLCSMMSFLTGTSFGTVSTMGVICMLISNAAGQQRISFSVTAVPLCPPAHSWYVPLQTRISTQILKIWSAPV